MSGSEGPGPPGGPIADARRLVPTNGTAVKDYLVSLGVEPSRIDTISCGEDRPLDPAHDEMAWALNHRVHLKVRVRQ